MDATPHSVGWNSKPGLGSAVPPGGRGGTRKEARSSALRLFGGGRGGSERLNVDPFLTEFALHDAVAGGAEIAPFFGTTPAGDMVLSFDVGVLAAEDALPRAFGAGGVGGNCTLELVANSEHGVESPGPVEVSPEGIVGEDIPFPEAFGELSTVGGDMEVSDLDEKGKQFVLGLDGENGPAGESGERQAEVVAIRDGLGKGFGKGGATAVNKHIVISGKPAKGSSDNVGLGKEVGTRTS